MKLKQFRLVKFVISLAAVARGGPGGGVTSCFCTLSGTQPFRRKLISLN